MALLGGADTFFIGTTHPARGADASHRGGPAGFVRVDGGALWWPVYSGNNMFNTLGNLAVNPVRGLAVPRLRHRTHAATLRTATTEWATPGAVGDDDATGLFTSASTT